ncbi:glucuronyl esterase domain-containing protein [Pseudoponticoccus marisrubri]|uniref:4-O-methyl-glucuronoyl methylesterase-like domain-containing protein n=1 Tax=Pseudoponticoccus marisrubri TaxID=1685382 RepID=A0A0W7WFX3_9RHOB|nr:alpha/beta hydrolase [Pseudoponticoccus marisrubri]KUF09368.1 hypothetical protein AVJ23_18160 [Pseudoponticoccus marisrubri]
MPGLCAASRARVLSELAGSLYGPVPRPPDALEVSCQPWTGSHALWLRITARVGTGAFTVDAALWLPSGPGPAPLIAGLDFLGPVGMSADPGFPLDPDAVVSPRPDLGAADGRLRDAMRGASTYRWPRDLLLRRGYALLLSCYGSWVPDDPQAWRAHGVKPLIDPDGPSGAISLWAWALMRLLDVAEKWPEIDAGRMTVAGHSRLGKAALWAAAQDGRIRGVYANQSGCAGAALSRHPEGETLAQLADRFPHWLCPDPVTDPGALPMDQDRLIAACAPRGVYLAAAAGDGWADPAGSYRALQMAARAWPDAHIDTPPEIALRPDQPILSGPLGWHLRPGGHEMLPQDWVRVLNWLDRLSPASEDARDHRGRAG